MTKAEEFLNDWAKKYEESEGAVSQPDFTSCDTNYTDNGIPHYLFTDDSVIIAIRYQDKALQWKHFETAEVLDDVIDVPYYDKGLYLNYSVDDVVEAQ